LNKPIDIESYFSKSNHINKHHVAKGMIENGYNDTKDTIFKNYFTIDKIKQTEWKFPRLKTASKIIRDAGGAVGIAHPERIAIQDKLKFIKDIMPHITIIEAIYNYREFRNSK